jgi:hypothetical protein
MGFTHNIGIVRRDSVVVKALCYKVEGRGLETRWDEWFFFSVYLILDRLCGLVVRVLGYRSGDPGSIPGITRKKKVVGLERGPLSLVSTTGELLDRKVAAPV